MRCIPCSNYPRIIRTRPCRCKSFCFDVHYLQRFWICKSKEIILKKEESKSINKDTFCGMKKLRRTLIMDRNKYNTLNNKVHYYDRDKPQWYIKFFEGNTLAQMPHIMELIYNNTIIEGIILDLSIDSINSIIDTCGVVKNWSDNDYTRCINMYVTAGIIKQTTSIGDYYEILSDKFINARLFKFISTVKDMYGK